MICPTSEKLISIVFDQYGELREVPIVALEYVGRFLSYLEPTGNPAAAVQFPCGLIYAVGAKKYFNDASSYAAECRPPMQEKARTV